MCRVPPSPLDPLRPSLLGGVFDHGGASGHIDVHCPRAPEAIHAARAASSSHPAARPRAAEAYHSPNWAEDTPMGSRTAKPARLRLFVPWAGGLVPIVGWQRRPQTSGALRFHRGTDVLPDKVSSYAGFGVRPESMIVQSSIQVVFFSQLICLLCTWCEKLSLARARKLSHSLRCLSRLPPPPLSRHVIRTSTRVVFRVRGGGPILLT